MSPRPSLGLWRLRPLLSRRSRGRQGKGAESLGVSICVSLPSVLRWTIRILSNMGVLQKAGALSLLLVDRTDMLRTGRARAQGERGTTPTIEPHAQRAGVLL